MRTDDIEILLNRYYEGVTTEEEERRLRDFFETADVPEHLKADKEMFVQMARYRDNDVPQGLDDRLSAVIDRASAMCRIKLMRIIGSVAVMLCIIFALGTYTCHDDYGVTAKDTCSTPEEAAVQTERALMAFSKALKKGKSSIDRAEQTTDKANKIIIEQLKKLNNR